MLVPNNVKIFRLLFLLILWN